MTPDDPLDERPKAELAEQEAEKDGQVLDREGVEQGLMQKDESTVGEEIDDVEDE